ncbi:MAG: molybdate ABC transporter permease subunit [Alphaproteobacteria bacterium]|nr:molybdate ABC transporter permease subunit [Alphaproteobacteria bacterium]
MSFSLTTLEIEALTLSLRVATWSVLVSLVPGAAIAWLLARRSFVGKGLLDALVHLPLVLPPVAVGYVLLLTLGKQGLIGGWLDRFFGFTLAFTWQGAALASGVMAFPLLVRSLRLSFEAIDRRIETAARTLGAGPFDVFRNVTLPLALPGLLTGVVLAFTRSLGEFGATIAFAASIPGETQTLSLALYAAMQSPGNEDAAFRLMCLSFVVAYIALIGSEACARRIDRWIGSRA